MAEANFDLDFDLDEVAVNNSGKGRIKNANLELTAEKFLQERTQGNTKKNMKTALNTFYAFLQGG